MKPILFNTEMVRAILDGRKTVTRRVVKPANPFRNCEGYRQGSGLWIDGYSKDDEPNGHIKDYSVSPCWYRKEDYIRLYAPYKVNDILYVRETWQEAYELDDNDQIIEGTEKYIYAASPEGVPNFTHWVDDNGVHRDTVLWRPSIHMPKEAARIYLRVTGVRVERLQDMGRKEALKEGCPSRIVGNNIFKITAKTETGEEIEQNGIEMCVVDFASLWNTTVKKDQLQYYGWDANPYVWVIEFEVIDKAAAFKEG